MASDLPFVVRHHYAPGYASAVIGPGDIDLRRAAVHIQFCAEEWFGDQTMLSNESIAKALVEFYGCRHAAVPDDAERRDWRGPGVVDLYWHRDYSWEGRGDLGRVTDETLVRDGLRDFIEPLERF